MYITLGDLGSEMPRRKMCPDEERLMEQIQMQACLPPGKTEYPIRNKGTRSECRGIPTCKYPSGYRGYSDGSSDTGPCQLPNGSQGMLTVAGCKPIPAPAPRPIWNTPAPRPIWNTPAPRPIWNTPAPRPVKPFSLWDWLVSVWS